MKVRRQIGRRADAAFKADPGFKQRPLADLNREAAALYKASTNAPPRCTEDLLCTVLRAVCPLLNCSLFVSMGSVDVDEPGHQGITRSYYLTRFEMPTASVMPCVSYP